MAGANYLCRAPANSEGRRACGALVFKVRLEGKIAKSRRIMLRASTYGALAIMNICSVPGARWRGPIQDIGTDEHDAVVCRAQCTCGFTWSDHGEQVQSWNITTQGTGVELYFASSHLQVGEGLRRMDAASFMSGLKLRPPKIFPQGLKPIHIARLMSQGLPTDAGNSG